MEQKSSSDDEPSVGKLPFTENIKNELIKFDEKPSHQFKPIHSNSQHEFHNVFHLIEDEKMRRK